MPKHKECDRLKKACDDVKESLNEILYRISEGNPEVNDVEILMNIIGYAVYIARLEFKGRIDGEIDRAVKEAREMAVEHQKNGFIMTETEQEFEREKQWQK